MRDDLHGNGESRGRRGFWVLLAAGLLALGMALGPMVAGGLTTALTAVKISGAIELPARTPVHIFKKVTITAESGGSGVAMAYTVPAGKWLVVRSVSARGTGPNKLRTMTVDCYRGPNLAPVDTQQIPFTVAPGGTTWSNYAAFEDMEWYMPAASQIRVGAQTYEDPPAGPYDVTHSYDVSFYISGYLTAKP